MEFAYRPELWEHLFEMVALAAVTLTGLLSVALSINLRAIIKSPTHLARCREVLFALTVLLAVSIFVLIPEQGRAALGTELLVLSTLVLAVTLRLQRRTMLRMDPGQRRSWARRLVGLNSATAAIAVAGASLIAGRLGGFLWLVITILINLVWSTYNAWSLAIGAVNERE